MKTMDFDYRLPPELIAQRSAQPRDQARLLVLNRLRGTMEHRFFYEISDFLNPGDLLVINESKVFKARLNATVEAQFIAPRGVMNHTPARIELFLLRPEGKAWQALAKPGKKLKVGKEMCFADGTHAKVIEKNPDGTIRLDFERSAEEIFAWTNQVGEVPTPPYVTEHLERESDYQTTYAKTVGSVAAPTAGFHFTPELLEKLKAQGVHFAAVTLHIGLGTFRPIKTETIEDHVMHDEWLEVSDETRAKIRETRQKGGRVIAVGTTTVRALESDMARGLTDIFITPGYRFKMIDGLITNFHLPKSTLLVLVSALAGQDLIRKAYAEAIEKRYRFYSFGDAMLIL